MASVLITQFDFIIWDTASSKSRVKIQSTGGYPRLSSTVVLQYSPANKLISTVVTITIYNSFRVRFYRFFDNFLKLAGSCLKIVERCLTYLQVAIQLSITKR
jgi:hypothetical protein